MTWDGETLPAAIDVARTTDGQPFCAGVVLCDGTRVLLTLNTDHLPPDLRGRALRIGGVGGGQELGESILDCARREACEELSLPDVTLRSSSRTFLHDLDDGRLARVACGDTLAPLLFQRKRRPHPNIPYRPGLPTGPYIYFALYLAHQPAEPMHPGDDVRALLWLPLALGTTLDGTVTLGAVCDAGATLIAAAPLSDDSRIWMPSERDESMRTVARILLEHPSL